ncbi:MAG TPA: hypothetical protein VEV39_08445 [Gemmatimonadales bacterium]|nr:hypothetical protein [Gemmatimonadales bacterium]
MQRAWLLILVAAVVGTACHRPSEVSRHTIAQSLRGVMVYPRSALVDMSSGDSAGQMTLSSPDAPDTVATWFRANLLLNDWTLETDAKQTDGSIQMYAERKHQPLWITIQRASGAAGSSYTVTGAITGSSDSTADATQRSGSSMSSKRIQRR